MRPFARRCRGVLLVLALIVPAGGLVAQVAGSASRVSLVETIHDELPADPVDLEFDDRGAASVPFGDAVALLPLNLHEPGVPYSVRVVSADADVLIEREGRSILDVRALEHHLVIASRGTGFAAVTLGEVIDESGRVAWTFTAPGDVPPRVAVGEGRAVAVYPGRRESIVELQDAESPATGRWVVSGAVLTQAALSTGGDEILVWGPRQVAWIDASESGIAWRASVAGAARPLAATTSGVTPVAGQVGVPVRERRTDGTWQVDLLLLDAGDGRIVSREPLHRTEEMPTAFGRHRRGEAERLVLRRHTYEIGAQPVKAP